MGGSLVLRTDLFGVVQGSQDTDWTARSTATGVMRTFKPTSQADVTAITHNEDGFHLGTPNWTALHVLYDSGTKASGAGSLHFRVLNADGSSNGQTKFLLRSDGHAFGPGEEFYVQWRQYMPTNFCQRAFVSDGSGQTPNDPGFGGGIKQIIISELSNSNVVGEIVVENTRQRSCPMLYIQDQGGSDHFIETSYNNGNSIRFQNQINNAAIADPNGTLTYPTATQKYGVMYNMTPIHTGAPDPNNGGYVYLPNQWQTFEIHVRVGTWGGSNTLVEMWCAGEGVAPTLVHRTTTANPGQLPIGGYQAAWFLPYCTSRTHNSIVAPFDTDVWYDEIITSTQPINFPGGFTITPYLGNTTLALAAASLASNAWTTINIANTISTDPSSAGDGFFSYSHHMVWDDLHGKSIFWSGCHGGVITNVQRTWLNEYASGNNRWDASIAVPGGSSTSFSHGYYSGTVDQATGDVYGVCAFLSPEIVHKYTYATQTWSTPFPTKPGRVDSTACMEYHPGLYGGTGGILYGNSAGIWSINPRAASPVWTLIFDRTNQVDAMGDNTFSAVSCYCEKDLAVYMGGGFSTNFPGQVPLRKIPNSAGAGTSTAIAINPVPFGTWDDGNAAMLLDSGGGGNMIAFGHNGVVHEYISSSNSWAVVSTSVPSGLTSTTLCALGTVRPYDCIIGVSGTSTITNTVLHLWKR